MLPHANRDFRVGAELFDAKLVFALNSPLSRKEIKAQAENEYEAVRNQIDIAREVYAERFMIDAGHLNHDPLMRLINLKWYPRVVTNAIIDSAIHVDGMTRIKIPKRQTPAEAGV